MRTSTGSIPNHTSTVSSKTYSPSVPLSVYRDLAGELQAAEAMLDAITAQNQQLVQENQLLRQEITKAVQSFLHLQKLVDPATASYNQNSRASVKTENQTKSNPQVNQTPPQRVTSLYSHKEVQPIVEMIPTIPEPIFIEEEEVRYYPHNESEPKEVNAWSLVIAILLIVLTAFGVGYLIVRPFFEHQTR